MFSAHKARSEAAWSEKTSKWDPIYQDLFRFTIPYRQAKGARNGKTDPRIEEIYDNTAMVSTFAGAGRLQHDLFPPGEKFFTFAIGPVAKQALLKKGEDPTELERELEAVADQLHALFGAEFEQSALEMCIDLHAGTGHLLPVEGDDDEPVRFVCVPMTEVALEAGPYGDVWGIFWKTSMSYRQIEGAFPKGKFSDEFKKKLEEAPGEPCELRQEWVYDPKAKRWRFVVWTPCSARDERFIFEDSSRAKPMATPRYHRVPGEAYGRGPGLLALPTTKTLNKAVELMLKSAAIQMLGIWAYRPNGAFNPATAKIAPGAFWPMSSTGGVMGADVQRMDPAGAKMEVAQLVTQEMRMQLQAQMNDDRLPDKGATPVSATEIMARMKRVSQNYVGAYGRLVNETIPVIVRRVAEIAHKKRLIRVSFKIDQLLVKIDVLSPMATAIKAQALSQVFQFIELVQAIKGPEAVQLLIKIDDLLRDAAKKMNVPAEFRMSPDETKALEAKLAAAAATVAAAQAAMEQGPTGPQAVPA